MKVLQINCVNKYGSTGRIVSQISDYITSKNVDNMVAYGVPRVDCDNGFVINSKLDAHIHSFLSRKLCRQGLASRMPTKRLIRFIKKYDPDIIHLHNIHGHYLNYKLLFKFLSSSRAKIVWTLHDCWSMTGKCAHFTKVGCYKWASEEGCNNCPQLNTYPDSTRDRSQKNFRDKKNSFTSVKNLTIATVSNWLKSVCQRSYLKDSNIVCIHNGVNTDVFKPVMDTDIKEKYGLQGYKIVIGVSNIWNGEKGEDQFVELSKLLPENYRVVLVGRGSDNVAQRSNKIIGIPQTNSQRELAELYSMADAFVSSSIEESFSLVKFEAMACGTPAIVYNSTSLPEAMADGCGYLVDVGDVKKMAEYAQYCAENKEQFSEKCVSVVRSNYTIEHMCDRYYNLYLELNGEKNGN